MSWSREACSPPPALVEQSHVLGDHSSFEVAFDDGHADWKLPRQHGSAVAQLLNSSNGYPDDPGSTANFTCMMKQKIGPDFRLREVLVASAVDAMMNIESFMSSLFGGAFVLGGLAAMLCACMFHMCTPIDNFHPGACNRVALCYLIALVPLLLLPLTTCVAFAVFAFIAFPVITKQGWHHLDWDILLCVPMPFGGEHLALSLYVLPVYALIFLWSLRGLAKVEFQKPDEKVFTFLYTDATIRVFDAWVFNQMGDVYTEWSIVVTSKGHAPRWMWWLWVATSLVLFCTVVAASLRHYFGFFQPMPSCRSCATSLLQRCRSCAASLFQCGSSLQRQMRREDDAPNPLSEQDFQRSLAQHDKPNPLSKMQFQRLLLFELVCEDIPQLCLSSFNFMPFLSHSVPDQYILYNFTNSFLAVLCLVIKFITLWCATEDDEDGADQSSEYFDESSRFTSETCVGSEDQSKPP